MFIKIVNTLFIMTQITTILGVIKGVVWFFIAILGTQVIKLFTDFLYAQTWSNPTLLIVIKMMIWIFYVFIMILMPLIYITNKHKEVASI